MSAGGTPTEEIARLVGHTDTTTTERVYRHELRPVIQTGATVMDQVFSVQVVAPDWHMEPLFRMPGDGVTR